MNTKEAIEETRQVFWIEYGKFGNTKADEIINLLEQGEKYRQIWDKFYLTYGNFLMKIFGERCYVNIVMDKFKQKYFPKGK